MEAASAEVTLPARLPLLKQPPAPDFTSAEAVAPYNEEAKSLLGGQKTAETGSQPQERQLRHRFSLARLRDSVKRSITKHDVAAVFDRLLHIPRLRPPGLAKAVLNHAPGTTIDELWQYLREDSNHLQQRQPIVGDKAPWLDIVTQGENLDYVHLLCHTKVSQRLLDDALGLALSRNSLPTIELLLQYGACATAYRDLIRDRLKSDNVRLAGLLLAAPSAMAYEDWRYCLASRASSAPSVFALCLIYYPSLTSPQLLLEALGSANLPAVKAMLDSRYAADQIRSVSVEACRRAHVIENDGKRFKALIMLAEAGMIRDTSFLQDELGRAVRLRQSFLIRTLVDAGVSLDANANNALGNAIAGMAFDILQSFTEGECVPPLTPSLDYVSDSASERDILRLFAIFRNHIGGPCDPLHRQLLRAVQDQRAELVQTLLSYGAAVSFEESESVKKAIRQTNLNMLRILLAAECSEKILSDAIPMALTLTSKPMRYEIMLLLLSKGRAPPQILAASLQQLVSAAGEADLKLIQLLLDHKAPLDGYTGTSDNCIFVCTMKGDLQLLHMLCEAGPENATLAQAVPLAFRISVKINYKVALSIMVKLLSSGAEGALVHRTLLDAAKYDKPLNFVRALLKYGADANHEAGAAYAAALENGSWDLLLMMCKACAPTQATLENILSKAVEPRWYKETALELLLKSAASDTVTTALTSWWQLAKHRDNPSAGSFIPLLLKYGMDVNVENGSLLCFAIQKQNVELLKRMLSARPSIATLSTGLTAAVALPTKAVGLNMMDLLLSQAKSAEIGQSKLLPQYTHAAVAGNLLGVNILLRHRADVNFDNGNAIQIAAEAASLEVLDLLIKSRPVWSSVNAACTIVLRASLESKQKHAIFQRLLDGAAAMSAKDASQLLTSSLARHPTCKELPALLLARGAEPDLETCQVAFGKISIERYITLLRHIKNKDVASTVFKHTVNAEVSTSIRRQIYECLLSKGVVSNEVSVALGHILKTEREMDITILELLLKHGADVGYDKGMAFRRALLDAGSLDAFTLLIQYIKKDSTACVAFTTAKKANITHNQRITIFRSLLMKWNIRGPALQETLVSLLKNGRSDPAMLQLLLQNGADPNKDEAQCFIMACTANAESEFRSLSSKADPAVVLRALMKHFRDEGQVVGWFNKCLKEISSSTKLEDGELLFECLRKFPKGTTLLKLLLSRGVPASATKLHSLCEGWPQEQCTALIWSLSAKPKIDNDVVYTLLDRAGDDALPAYSTSSKEVSAGFLCLLDKSRTDILEALLRLNEDQIMASSIPGGSFEQLAIYPAVYHPRSDDFPARLPLPTAAMVLGNFDAFRLLSRNRVQNDGNLHNAAFFALPRFVKELLKTDDPNASSDDFEGRIPLAVACVAKYMPFCKFGNERDFRTRQRETMELLAPCTDLKYHEKHKTLLHIALHNGPETTAAMLGALKVASDPNKHTRYRYADQNRRQYSPREYVMEIMGCESEQKEALLACLSKAGLDAVPGSWL
jgi:hypothetical protein